MSNRHPNDFPVDPYVVNGGVLAERLTRLVESLDTRESGYARPSYAQRGTIWLDESNIIGSPSTVKMMVFDGAHDVLLHEVNVDSGEVIGGGGVGGRAWDDLQQYKTGDVVTEATFLYIAIQDSTGSAPSTHPLDWLLFDIPDYDGVIPYADIASLREAPTGVGSVAYLSQDGRAGNFKWSSADHATDVTADTQSGIYVAPDSDLTGSSGAWVRQYEGDIPLAIFGMSESSDNTAILEGNLFSGGSVLLPQGSYDMDKCFALLTSPTVVRGVGNVELVKSLSGAVAYCSWKSNCQFENITIRNILASVGQIRTVVESNVVLRNINVFDNTHVNAAADAWGFYFKNMDGAVLYDCGASGNSQSDFTFVDGVKNVTVINAGDGGHGSGCKINFEPNTYTLGGTENVQFIGGNFTELTLIENDNRGVLNRNICFKGSTIGSVAYSGSDVNFVDCEIGSFAESTVGGKTFGGSLRCNTMHVGKNLIKDPNVSDISRDDTSSYWTPGTSSLAADLRYSRITAPNGEIFTRLNPTNTSGSTTLVHRDFTPVDISKEYVATIKAQVDNTSITDGKTEVLFVDWHGAADAYISSTTIRVCRSAVSVLTDLQINSGIVTPPVGALSGRVRVGFPSATTASMDIYALGLHVIERFSQGGNFNSEIDLLDNSKTLIRTQDHIPANNAGFYYPNSFVGEIIYEEAPVSSGNIGTVCVTAGTPGTWKTFGAISA